MNAVPIVFFNMLLCCLSFKVVDSRLFDGTEECEPKITSVTPDIELTCDHSPTTTNSDDENEDCDKLLCMLLAQRMQLKNKLR